MVCMYHVCSPEQSRNFLFAAPFLFRADRAWSHDVDPIKPTGGRSAASLPRCRCPGACARRFRCVRRDRTQDSASGPALLERRPARSLLGRCRCRHPDGPRKGMMLRELLLAVMMCSGACAQGSAPDETAKRAATSSPPTCDGALKQGGLVICHAAPGETMTVAGVRQVVDDTGRASLASAQTRPR